MNHWREFLIRISAFLRKEIFELMRQPLLVTTLILGPFLILLFFGIGFRNEAQALRTMFVVEDNDPLRAEVERYANSLGPQLLYSGITADFDEARAALSRGEIDLITVVPHNAYTTIQESEQAVFELYHQEIDPVASEYINIFGRVYVDAINRQVLNLITRQGQTNVTQVQGTLDQARAIAIDLQTLLERCAKLLNEEADVTAAEPSPDLDACTSDALREYALELDQQIDEVDAAVGDNIRLAEAVEEGLNVYNTEFNPESPVDSLRDLINNANELARIEEDVDSYLESANLLVNLEDDLDNIERYLNEFLSVNPSVLISPFRSEATSIATIIPTSADYYTPPAIILLLQHLAITFAALSMVRDRNLGTMELFYIAPLSAIETLLGKYISYLLFGGVLALILMLLIVFGMGVPMLGSWLAAGLIIWGLLFTALGLGFVISLVSKTDIQAVQYSMIVLLSSVFFSGFIVGLEQLWQPVTIISWSLPATYATVLLRDLMLRGYSLDWTIFLALVGTGLAFFLVSWGLLQWSMSRGQDL